MKKKMLLFLVLVLAGLISKAQNPQLGGFGMNTEAGVIIGNVTDKGLATPIEYASVVLYKQTDSTMITGILTDATGGFFLSEVPFGSYYLKADFIGYDSQIISDINLSEDNKFFRIDTIYLEQSSAELEEIEIFAVKDYIKYEIDKKVVNVSQHPNAAGGSAADVLENTPSVTVDMDGNVNLRGSSNFTVLIDGKPTVLDANDVLQQTPASMIETIEIITNPSAKYDPDGTSGIINIVLKEDIVTGVNGIVNASYGTWNKYSADFLLNYRAKKINFFVGADYKDSPRNSESISERENYLTDTIEYIYSSGERGHSHGGYSAKGGLDIYLNDENTLSFSANAGEFIFAMNNNFNYSYWTNPETVNNYFISNGTNEINSTYFNGDVSYQLKLPDDELNIYGYYSQKTGGSIESQKDTYTDSLWNELEIDNVEHISTNDENRYNVKFKVDYTRTISETTSFEAGYSGEVSTVDYDFLYQNYDNDLNDWVTNSEFTNISSYSNNIQAAYTSISGELLGFGYMAGLRGEYTKRIFEQITMNEDYPFEKFSFFPSAYITKEFGKENQLQFNYSRRINRPQEWFLNPFPMYSDQYSIMYGNPDLEPEYTNSFELNYQKSFGMSFVSVETFYRKTDNVMSRISEIQDDGRLAMFMKNINSETNYGAELMGNFTLFKIMLLNPSFSIYQYKVEGEVDDVSRVKESLNYQGMLSAMFFITKSTKLQIMSFYNSKSATLQGDSEGNIGVRASVKQELFSKKLTLSLSMRDVFGSMKWEYTSTGEGYSLFTSFTPEYPNITFNISYKINNYTKKTFDSENGEIPVDGSF
jgi:outer membrane receptor protein involved in Fe transport